jgi:DNA topoisomerase-1
MTARTGAEETESPAAADSRESAVSAGLRYVSDATPGIRRWRAGNGYSYRGPDGSTIGDAETLHRIRSLAIPPAWTDVWICPQPRGHIQATGRDAKGRKQYRYHPRWRAVRDETKYARMLAFGRALPRIRERVEQDLKLPGLPRAKVLGTVVRLLDATAIRVGNEEYAKQNGAFGLTTLRNRHVDLSGTTIRFHFRGKAGRRHSIELRDRRLVRIIQRCRDLPGYELFQYLDDEGERQSIDAADVNAYLRESAGEEFTAKDFRTWTGTVLASTALRACEAAASQAEAKKQIARAIESVAAGLGNTPAVCRKSYVHPAVLDAHLDGTLSDELRSNGVPLPPEKDSKHGPRPEEATVLALLERRLCHRTSPDRSTVPAA